MSFPRAIENGTDRAGATPTTFNDLLGPGKVQRKRMSTPDGWQSPI
jgi:hypothetical protein